VSIMARPGDRTGAGGRRTRLLDRVAQLGRGRRAAERAGPEPADAQERIQTLEARIDQLEALVEGLQDAVHRESIRQDGRIRALEKRSEPAEISRALSRDARKRGI
jgi:hypothetical protein